MLTRGAGTRGRMHSAWVHSMSSCIVGKGSVLKGGTHDVCYHTVAGQLEQVLFEDPLLPRGKEQEG